MSDISMDDLRKELEDGTQVVVVCSRPTASTAVPPVPEGTTRGFFCRKCGVELQATPAGQEKITAGGVPLCVRCGIEYTREAEKDGTLGGIALSPEAAASLASGRISREGEEAYRLFTKTPYKPRDPGSCPHCHEQVLAGEANPYLPNMQAYHYECVVRMVAGSAAHQLGECSCTGGDRDDPPGLTRRQAAKLALETFNTLRGKAVALESIQ